MLRSISLTLVLEGFMVETATDGAEALGLIESAPFDLIVLDLEMPRMDGRALYRELRARDSSVPIVALSAFGDQAALGEMDVEAAVPKPFEPGSLVERIRTCCPEE